ncbi:hypothetical protein IHN32_04510 [Deinococcus sp. 14RED07]|uniref:hypothetical protein n=1 Tax=Deinococcus sp. 14RED07 TaxID=2745874 RepID=UPI001E328CC9|nr:hypothetical protein [Deinococcus sp. 14RED07]MCD0175210.1 hypothetical protein [Deinococcus sp. 14RED07]
MTRLDSRKLEQQLRALLAVPQAMPAAAPQVAREALGHAIIGAQANIYNTARSSGGYERTFEYMRSLDAVARTTKTRVSIRVTSDAEYALVIETGREGNLDQLQARALARNNAAAAFTQGRSGIAWWLPGPVITGAQVYAARRLQELFLKKVRAALR